MREVDRRILRKIVSEIRYLESLLDQVDQDSFLADETMERAAAMTSINIGELAKWLSDDFFLENPTSELKLAAKTRDVYAHGYFTLSSETVYKTAVEDYPRVRKWIETTLENSNES